MSGGRGYRLDSLRTEREGGASSSVAIGSGDNGVVTISVDAAGVAGDAYTVVVEDGVGNSQPLAADLSGTALTVTLATDGGGDPDDAANTATLVAAAIDGETGVSAAASGTGASVIEAATVVSFAGGRNPYTVPQLAKMANLTDEYVRQIEWGSSCEPQEAASLAAALGVSLSTLGAAGL